MTFAHLSSEIFSNRFGSAKKVCSKELIVEYWMVNDSLEQGRIHAHVHDTENGKQPEL